MIHKSRPSSSTVEGRNNDANAWQTIPSDNEEIITLPYYGGAKGQILQIRKKPDGSIETEIVKDGAVKINGMTPPKPKESFYYNLYEIQKAASELVKLQDKVKKTGVLTDESQREYTENLEKLGISAQKLAHIQRESGLKDEFKLLFEETQSLINVDGKIQETLDRLDALSANKRPPSDDFDKVFEDSKIEEYFKGQATTQKTDTTTLRDAQIVNAPSEDASIAEAKPVGLAIAGKGGVASSRPQATAIVGNGGLAVANPVATAIAGLSLEDVDELGIPIQKKDPTQLNVLPKFRTSVTERLNLPFKGKYGLAESSIDQNIGVLVGPQYKSDARVSDSEIQSELEEKLSTVMNRNEKFKESGFIEKEGNRNNFKTRTPEGPNFPLAIAPEQIIPNQYPLIPPNYNSYLNFVRTHINPEQNAQFSAPPYGPFDQSLLHDRSLAHTPNLDYDESIEPGSGIQYPFYQPHPQYPAYPIVFY